MQYISMIMFSCVVFFADRPYEAARNSLEDPQESDCDEYASDFSESISSINNDSDFSNTFADQTTSRYLLPGNLVTPNVRYEWRQRNSQDADTEQNQENCNKQIYDHCAAHQNKLKSHICEECKEWICFTCGKTEHKEHSWHEVSEFAAAIREKQDDYTHNVTVNVLPNLLNYRKQLEKIKMVNASTFDQTVKTMEGVRRHLHEEIDTAIDRMKTPYEEKHNRNMDNLKEKEKEITEDIDVVQKYGNHNDPVMTEGERDRIEISRYLQIQNIASRSKVFNFDSLKESTRFVKGNVNTQDLKKMVGSLAHDAKLELESGFKVDMPIISQIIPTTGNKSWLFSIDEKSMVMVNMAGDKEGTKRLPRYSECLAITSGNDAYMTDFRNKCIIWLQDFQFRKKFSLSEYPLSITSALPSGLLVTVAPKREALSGFVLLMTFDMKIAQKFGVGRDKTPQLKSPTKAVASSKGEVAVIEHLSEKSSQITLFAKNGGNVGTFDDSPKDRVLVDLAYDEHHNIICADNANNELLLLSDKGELVRSLLQNVTRVSCLALRDQHLWLGQENKSVQVFKLMYGWEK